MTTPQDPARRKKQKRRREKQLSTWRATHGAPPDAVPATDKADKASSVAKRAG